MSLHTRNIRAVVRIGNNRYDYALVYDLLKIVYERSLQSQHTSLRKLFEEYRARKGVKVNYYTVKRHAEFALKCGLLEKRGVKPAVLVLTKKGVDYIFLFERLLELTREAK
jgi:hypothetical protein